MKKGYGLKIKFISFFLLIFFSIINYSSLEAASNNLKKKEYLNQLLDLAKKKNLAEDRYWQILLHYRNFLVGPKRSVIDDPDFFLSPEGKTNPQAELEETLKSFFITPEEAGGEKNHSVCRFLARYTWLNEQLNFDKSFLPLSTCPQYEKVIKKISPESAVLIFPTGHINSPASMFGHTLLVIKTKNQDQLLAHAVNYAALTNDTFGPIYAFKGLFGFYKGYFSILPYYLKIQEYSDVDLRDMWEYSLNLTKEEVDRMVRHLGEMENISSDYFFLDENCSYNLLFLLEAARPSLNLVEPFFYDFAISPVETIKVVEKNNLINKIDYRPSRASKINKIASLLDRQSQQLALNLCENEIETKDILKMEITPEDKIRIFDLAGEYAKHLNAKEKISKDKYKSLFIKILQARSTLGKAESEYILKIPPRPLQSHSLNRLAFSLGVRGDDLFQEIRYRPSYHSFLDNDQGYVKGAQVLFWDLALRFYPQDKEIKLNNFDLIDIMSISPLTKFFKAPSWKFKTGFRQKYFTQDKSNLIYQFIWGGGGTLSFDYLDFFYCLFELESNFGQSLERNLAAGLGGETGLIHQINPFWKINLALRNIYFPLGEKHNELNFDINNSFFLEKNNSVMAIFSRKKSFDFYQNEFSLRWNLFF